jgi:LysR family glycine cleavage system transcriptional activator
LLRDAFFPVCSPALLTGEHPIKSAGDLRHHALIHDMSMSFESTFPTWRVWLRNAGFPDMDCERGLQINDSAAVIQAAIAGNGVALGRTTLVARDLAEGRLVRPFGEGLLYDFAYYIIHKSENGAEPAIVAFREWLLSEAALDL